MMDNKSGAALPAQRQTVKKVKQLQISVYGAPENKLMVQHPSSGCTKAS